MTNVKALEKVMDGRGIKRQFVANSLGLTYQGFLYKLSQRSDFTIPEAQKLVEVLRLTDDERNEIFFSKEVEC